MNLKTLRELKGISRKGLAEMTGVSFRSIQDYEQGHKELCSAKAETILKMARALDCTMEDLISDVDLSFYKPSELEQMVKAESIHKNNATDAILYNSVDLVDIPGKAIRTSEMDLRDGLLYELMHKDDRVASVVFEPVTGALVSVVEIYNRALLPIGTDGDSELLKAWWYRRAVPVTQGHITEVLEKIGILTPQAYLLRAMGLSLTDDYWVKAVSDSETWDEVNLFDNDFDDLIGASHFAGFNPQAGANKFSWRMPSGATGGVVPKSWICMDGKRYLVKGAQTGRTQQIINEVVGAYIHRKQNKFDFVDYQFYTIDYGHGKQLGVSAEAFTSKNLEFISAADIIRAGRMLHDGASDYDIFVDACAKGGLDRVQVEAFLDYQILSDFIITNTDRNYENFGVLRDADTLEFVKMAPIFDSGNSMFYDLDMSHGTLDLNNISVKSFADNETGLMRLVKDASVLNLDSLLTDDELSKVLASSSRTPDEVRVLVTIYDRKKDLLFKFKRGETNWLKG